MSARAERRRHRGAVAELYRRLDAALADVARLAARGGHTVACAGCADPSCCEDVVWTSDAEARALAAAVPDLAARLRRWQATAGPALAAACELAPEGEPRRLAVRRYHRAGVPCPLLDADGRCAAYAVRPLPCRLHVAIGDPATCRAFARGDAPDTQCVDPTWIIERAGVPLAAAWDNAPRRPLGLALVALVEGRPRA